AAGNEVVNNYLTHQKIDQLQACLKGRGCSTDEQKKRILQEAEELSKFLDRELNATCERNPGGDACRNAINAATQYVAMSEAWLIMNGDVSRSSENLFEYIYNRPGAGNKFPLYYNTIDNRADFFGAMNEYERNN